MSVSACPFCGSPQVQVVGAAPNYTSAMVRCAACGESAHVPFPPTGERPERNVNGGDVLRDSRVADFKKRY
jgi:CxxC-x17-CxxC domain-containing protein